jgi:hypothetical protein
MMHVFLILFLTVQGPSPETAPPVFPGGAYVSYNSIVGARDSRPHEGLIALAAGLRRDLQLSVQSAVVTMESNRDRKTEIGDSIISLKYRFLRLDSSRGTTQWSAAAGPRLGSPTSGSPADLYLNTCFTYTGLFDIKKLVADFSTDVFPRNEEVNSRFWLSYRPYQSQGVGAEWWIGPNLGWQQNVIEHGTTWVPGITTYISPAAGTIFWAGFDKPDNNNRLSFGITRQFRLPGK